MVRENSISYDSLLTEQRNPRSENLDRMSIREIVDAMHEQDQMAVDAVGQVRDQIAAAIEIVTAALKNGGRLFYIGAGTSGRLGVLDASECPPTFSSPPELVQGIIAGGDYALRNSREGAEDEPEGGAKAIQEAEVNERDVVVGIASSGVTPFVYGGLQEAAFRGAKTIFLTCNPPEKVTIKVDQIIAPVVGPELLTGSTRLKSGTATKLVLNMITTTTMVQLGKVYGNLMVDLTAACGKLVDRSRRIVCALTDLQPAEADELLQRAGGSVKVAVLMHRRGVTREDAEKRLKEAEGFLRRALDDEG